MKPILFNTDMVKAILEGRKTVTRRVVKPQPEGQPVLMGKDSCWPGYFAIRGTAKVIPPPYQRTDNLWVRETWGEASDLLGGTPGVVYRADYTGAELLGLQEKHYRWHPSIHMPREAARIFLMVTDVRAERLQEITPEQIDAEGYKEWAFDAVTGALVPSSPSWFRIAWDNTIEPKDRTTYGWAANPWVWVIEFERLGKP